VWQVTNEIHHRVEPDPGPDPLDRQQATPQQVLIVALLVAIVVMLVAATRLAKLSKPTRRS